MSVVNFQQQGSFDWTALSKTGVNFTVDILERLSKAGIEGLTVSVAYYVFSAVKLGDDGQMRVHDCVSKLKVCSTFSKALTLGFGVKHILRTMADTLEGLSCVGLCAALMETYSPIRSARILKSMYEQLPQITTEASPSLQQWESLLNACTGALAHSTFGKVAFQMMKFSGASQKKAAAAAAPEAIATVLLALGQVSNGQFERITVTGDQDAGFIAAVAEWLLNLPVEIRNKDGVICYRSSQKQKITGAGNKRQGEIIIIYSPQDRSKDNSDDVSSPPGALAIVNRTYSLPSGTGIVKLDPRNYMGISWGRVPWDRVLQEVFGNSARRILSPSEDNDAPRTAGTYFGILARFYEGMASGNPAWNYQEDEGDFDLPTHSTRAYGAGFIATLTSWFPEIASNAYILEETWRAYYEAKKVSKYRFNAQYASAVLNLSQTCGCWWCWKSDDAERKEIKEPYCLVMVVETVAYLARILCQVNFWTSDSYVLGASDSQLKIMPTRDGLEYICNKVNSSLCGRRWMSRPGDSSNGDFKTPILKLILTPECLLRETAVIFTGLSSFDPEPERKYGTLTRAGKEQYKVSGSESAFTKGGLCIAIHALFETTDDPDIAGIIHILPGKIEWQGTTYQSVRDIDEDEDDATMLWGQYTWPATPYVKIDPMDPRSLSLLRKDTCMSPITCELEVLEDLNDPHFMTLYASYRLRWQGGSALIPPRWVTTASMKISAGPICNSKSECAATSAAALVGKGATENSTAPATLPRNFFDRRLDFKYFLASSEDCMVEGQAVQPYAQHDICEVYLRPFQSRVLSRWLSVRQFNVLELGEGYKYSYQELLLQNRSCIGCLSKIIAARLGYFVDDGMTEEESEEESGSDSNPKQNEESKEGSPSNSNTQQDKERQCKAKVFRYNILLRH